MAEYDLVFGSSAYVHVQEVLLKSGDQQMHSSGGGVLGGGWKNPNDPRSLPTGGKIHILAGEQIVPRSAYARWFSYEEQKYYQAEIIFPENLFETISEFATAFGENTSEPAIIFGFSPDGKIKVSIESSCSYIYECGKNNKSREIASGQGAPVSGDPNIYLPITKQLIRRGDIAPIKGIMP
ncbi:DUF2931 family protein [Pseudomonas sp. MBLB4123]|uniref:DUF2931 family protein n=1 Tax=Pseudomonas sp. MBLB4123 TaxID=3451557 RepID=UPI003F7541F4